MAKTQFLATGLWGSPKEANPPTTHTQKKFVIVKYSNFSKKRQKLRLRCVQRREGLMSLEESGTVLQRQSGLSPFLKGFVPGEVEKGHSRLWLPQ